MDIGQIETFVAIARLGSFSKAAAQLNRSQPAISRRLALLEATIGAPLFERIRKRVHLTDAGRALRPHAEAVLASTIGGATAVRDQLGQGAGTVSFGIVGTLVDSNLASILARFSLSREPSRLKIVTSSSEAISELVRAGEVVVGLRYFMDRNPEIQCQQIGWEEMVVVSAPRRAARGRSNARRRVSSSSRWIGFTNSKITREGFGALLTKRLEGAGIVEPDIMFVDSLSAQKRLVEAGVGLGFLPESSVREELSGGSLAVLKAPRVSTRIPVTLVHRRAGYLSPAANELMALVRSAWN